MEQQHRPSTETLRSNRKACEPGGGGQTEGEARRQAQAGQARGKGVDLYNATRLRMWGRRTHWGIGAGRVPAPLRMHVQKPEDGGQSEGSQSQ